MGNIEPPPPFRLPPLPPCRLPPPPPIPNLHQRTTRFTLPINLPITIRATDATSLLPITITYDSIITTGQWSPLPPHLVPLAARFHGLQLLGLTNPTRLTLPTTITISTNTFTILTIYVTTRSAMFDFATMMPKIGHHHITNTHPITTFPVTVVLNLTIPNTNTAIAVPIHITTNRIFITGHPLVGSNDWVTFLLMSSPTTPIPLSLSANAAPSLPPSEED